MLDQPIESASAGQHNPEFWTDDLRSWPGELLKGCGQIADGSDAPEQLQGAIHALIRMRDSASATPRYRPYLSGWQFIDTTIRHFFRLTQLYLEALCDDSPEHAAALGEQAQVEIDAAAAAARAYRDRTDRWNRVGLAAAKDPRLGPVIGIALATSGNATSEGDSQDNVYAAYAQIIGNADAARDPVMIASIRLQLVQVESICDVSRFVDVARQTYQALSAHSDRLKSLVQSPDWLCAYKQMNQELVEIGAETRRLLPEFNRPLSIARAMIRRSRTHGTMREAIGDHPPCGSNGQAVHPVTAK